MSMSLATALQLLNLTLPFDQLTLRKAFLRAVKQTHPDRNGAESTAACQQVQEAKDICEAHLKRTNPGTPPPRPSSPPPRDSGPTTSGGCSQRSTGGRAPQAGTWGFRVDDHRDHGGALWAGFAVPPSTPLPTGWRRAGDCTRKHPGQPWTTMPGDAQTLLAALLSHLRRVGALDPA